MSFNEELEAHMHKVEEANTKLNNLTEWNKEQTTSEWVVDPQIMDYFNQALPSVRLKAIRIYKEKLKTTKPKPSIEE